MPLTRLYPFSKNREGRVRKPFAVNADIFEISVNQLTGSAVSPLFAVSTLKMDKVETDLDYQLSRNPSTSHFASITVPISCSAVRTSFDATTNRLRELRITYQMPTSGLDLVNNSNAFAYTVLQNYNAVQANILGREFFRGFDVTRVPGWGHRIPGL